QCGDVISGAFTGQDSHAALGWISTSGSAFDTLGAEFNRIRPLTGGFQPPLAHFVGQVLGTGSDTFNVSDPSGTALNFIASSLRGVQPVVDVGVTAAPTPTGTSPIVYTINCTTLVPN